MFKSNKIIIAGLVVLTAGLILMIVGFSLGGFRFRNLNRISYEKKEYFSVSEINSICLEDKDTPVEFRRSTNEKIHVVYHESRFESYDIAETDGMLIFKKENTDFSFKFIVNMINFSSNDAIIFYIPNKEWESLDIETTNGKITANRLSAGEIKLRTTNGKITLEEIRTNSFEARTSNGKIDFENLDIQGEFRLQTTNGTVELDKISANSLSIITTNALIELENIDTPGEILVESTNGRLEFSEIRANYIEANTTNGRILAEELTAEDISFKTTNSRIVFEEIDFTNQMKCRSTNGAVLGNLPGNIADYSIKSRTTNAKNSLPESIELGDKFLEIETTNGRIDVTFGMVRDND